MTRTKDDRAALVAQWNDLRLRLDSDSETRPCRKIEEKAGMERPHLDRATAATSPRNHTHVLVHWESCLQGLEISATGSSRLGQPHDNLNESAPANSDTLPQNPKPEKQRLATDNRDCGPKQSLCHGQAAVTRSSAHLESWDLLYNIIFCYIAKI